MGCACLPGSDTCYVGESQQPCACLPALLQQGSIMPLLCLPVHQGFTACSGTSM